MNTGNKEKMVKDSMKSELHVDFHNFILREETGSDLDWMRARDPNGDEPSLRMKRKR